VLEDEYVATGSNTKHCRLNKVPEQRACGCSVIIGLFMIRIVVVVVARFLSAM
jgi:hypothetical protein